MAWYKTGTAVFTNGSATVTGSSTLWVDVGTLNIGDIVVGPDGKFYEVLTISSNTGLTLASNYLGSTTGSVAYAIMPIGLLPSALALQVKSTLNTANTALTSAVLFSASQGLTTTNQGYARANIAALGAADVGQGRLSKSVAGGVDVTLTAAEAANQFIELTGTLTANINVIVPAAARLFFIYNGTAGAYTLTVKTAAGTGVAVTQGGRKFLECDATNVVDPQSGVPGSFTTLSASGNISQPASAWTGIDAARGIVWDNGTTGSVWSNGGSIQLKTGGALSATLDSNGNLVVGATSTTPTSGGMAYAPNWSASGVGQLNLGHITGASSGTGFMQFFYAGGGIGGITQSGTTAVLYNTTSDYRLKANQQPLTGSGAFIDALKPTTWEWTRDGRRDAGFIAHEFAEVCPNAVNGVKDEMEEQTYEITPAVPATQAEDGTELTPMIPAVMGTRTVPKYQSMQASSSEVIANLVAELQSLRLRVAALEAK